MDLPKKVEEQISEVKSWFHEHFHKHHCDCGYHCHCGVPSLEHFNHHMHWLYLTKVLPGEVVSELHEISAKAHELFLGEHFKAAKKMKELEHKMEILRLDVTEHLHEKGTEFNKRIVSESLDALKKLKLEYTDLVDKEKERFSKVKKETEDKIYEKIQSYLKK